MDSNSKVFVAGHKGLVGSAIVRNLKAKEKLGWEPTTTFKELVEDMCIYGQ